MYRSLNLDNNWLIKGYKDERFHSILCQSWSSQASSLGDHIQEVSPNIKHRSKMQKFSSHHQLQLIIVLFISSVRVTSSKVLTILPTSTPANFSAPVHFDATQNLEESVIFKALKQFWWEYALNSKHQKNEVNNELSKIKALTPPEDTTAEHPHLHPYVDRLKIEMDEMVHQRQRGSNKEDHLPTHIVALEPSTRKYISKNL